ncbi:vWA domain-containing protein [Roseovarius pelagicus]|uniref:VWA domain-containing protein n=1 Tax=Roseovarius pelagicus TaxID=2980108 RepID=A0ABY6DKV7_9RHOB|nr:VWA domain-containing protein [Roseovarius pelagicus]UXX84410.1 VWA domain-containing protein [Roseovarius pelagicus]
MLVFDGSASMAELDFDLTVPTRIDDARRAVRRAMPQIAPFRRVGLLIYGPGPGPACDRINLHFEPVADAATPIVDALDQLEPLGLTPLTNAVRAAAKVLHYRTRPGIVVLVTDGNETCGGRPCALSRALAAEARDLTVHVIGFRVVVDFFSWDSPEAKSYTEGKTVAKCLADQTGGMFVSTETVDELAEALRETLGCALIGQTIGPIPSKQST